MSDDGVRLERPARMTHVAVRATDFEASLEFYRRYAQLRVTHERTDEGIRVAWLADRDDPARATGTPEAPVPAPALSESPQR